MQEIEEMTLEEKIDEILKYQRKVHKMAIVRAIFSFVIFFVLVILPIWGFYYLAAYFRDNVGINFSEIGETLQRVENVGSANGLSDLLTK